MLQWRGNRETLDPDFTGIVQHVLGTLPYIYIVSSGLRSMSTQDALYAQGRTAPGPIVTNARAGESPHNYGMAADIYPMVGGIVDFGDGPPVPGAAPAWAALWKAVAQEPRLTSGRGWIIGGGPDAGHVELRDWKAVAATMAPPSPSGGSFTPWGPDWTPAEGGQAPTWDADWYPSSDAPLGAAPGVYFELSPVAALAGVAVLGVVVYAWARRGRGDRSRRRRHLAA